MPHPRRLIPLLAAAVLAMASPSATADDKLVFAFEELLPWKTRHQGVYGGAYTEIVRELARRAQLPLEFRNCLLKRCLYMLEHGEADLAIGLRDTDERRKFLHFLKTPYREPALRSYADLTGLRIGVTSGAKYFDPFDSDKSIAVSKRSVDAATLDKLERAMEAMARDGTLAALIKRHYYDALNVPLDSVRIR